MSEPAHEPSNQPRHESPATAGAAADDDLLAALADDFAARARRGEHPGVEEYAARHPELAERIRKVLPAIAAIEGARSPDSTVAPIGEGPGSTIGRYKLLERIGEGGFGVVYMAEQHHPVRRRVALKVVKPGMDSRQVLTRFEAERQALAIMDHPNIAKVFDGGMTESGRPYFVMELVKGEPITEFCDRNQLPPRQRLELFAQVCHAVQHAHQKGIIHRDIKPTNVLVALHDTTPVVKVIDFGIAKALGQELTDKTLFTGFAQLIGTPLYMSPEQAGHSALDVDTRSDIYSLGVLLYELLTGTTPFDKERFKRAAEEEIRRIIREEEPPRPSTRLSESKDRLPSIWAQRHTEPGKLTRLVRGELDWIVMKALEKDRNRRYETAVGLARDVDRYLADEPVLACPPSAGYRLRKFVRRNKAAMAVTGLVLCFLVLTGSGVGWAVRDRAAREAEVARDRDARQAKVVGQVELILADVNRLEREQKWPEALAVARRAEAVLAGGDADAATAERVRERLKDLVFIDRLEQIRMQRAIWIEGKFDYAGAEREYARAFREYGVDVDTLAAETSTDRLKTRPALAIPLATALDDWFITRRVVPEGDAAGWKRLAAVARGIDPDPLRDRLRSRWDKPAAVADELRQVAESIDVRAHHPEALGSLAAILQTGRHSDSAIRLLRDAQHTYPGDFWLNFDLGLALDNQKDHEGAVRFYTAAVSIRPNAVAARNNLANSLAAQGKVDEAIAAYRKAIEIDPKFVNGYCNLGVQLAEQKKLPEAVTAYRKAIEIAPNDAKAYYGLGSTLADQKKLDEAVAAYRKAIELDPKYVGPYIGLGNALLAQKKLEEAIDAYSNAVRLEPNNAEWRRGLGIALFKQGKLHEAISEYRQAIKLKPDDGAAHYNLYLALERQGTMDQAIRALERVIELGPTHALRLNELAWLLATCHDANYRDAKRAVELAKRAVELMPRESKYWNTLGVALAEQKKLDEAVAAFRKALELDPTNAQACNCLGNALREQGKPDEAVAAFRKAIELDPKDTSAYYNLGYVLMAQRKMDEATAAFRKAIELDPKYTSAYYNLGYVLKDQRKMDEAIAAYRKAIELEPNNVNVYRGLGLALEDQGKLPEAIAAFERTLALDPQHPHASHELAWLLATCSDATLRDPNRAVALAKKAVGLNPADLHCQAVSWQTLGWAQYRAGDWKASVAALEKSMELQQSPRGGDSMQWFCLAMARWQLGDKDEARRWYDRAIEWMDENDPANREQLTRFRAEADELLGVSLEGKGVPSTAPAQQNAQPPQE